MANSKEINIRHDDAGKRYTRMAARTVIKKRFIQALPVDNPYLAPQYIHVLKEAFKHRPELLEAYLHGSWHALEGANQVIKDEWLRLAGERSAMWPFVKKYLVCDPARFGDDETVIYLLENTEIAEEVIMPYCRTTEISGRLATMSVQNENCQIVVESVGADIGAGVIDELVELDKDVILFNPQGKPDDPELYYNMRAEAWERAGKILSDGVIDRHSNCVVVLTNLGQTLRSQLCTPRYKFKRGKIIIEDKEAVKARLGHSPDRADTYVMGLWAWPFINVEAPEETSYRDKRRRQTEPESAMVC